MKWLIYLLSLFLVLNFIGCGDDGGEEKDSELLEFEEAIPDFSMIELEIDDSVSQKKDEMNQYRLETVELMENINNMIKNTADGMKALIQSYSSEAVTIDGKKCRVWQGDAPNMNMRLTVCYRPLLQRYGFALQGRALDSELEEDFLLLTAGNGKRLPRYTGLKRGFGFIGFDFDNIATLTDGNFGGKVGVSYRAAGAVRQVNVGLLETFGEENPQPYTALYRYTHIIGVGGFFKHLTTHDFLTTDGEGGIIEGTDGLDENGARVVAWSTLGHARVATLVCGGTLGEGNCYYHAHCWDADGNVTLDQITNDQVDWSSCGSITFMDDFDAPTMDEVQLNSSGDEETGAPSLDIPEENPNE